MKKLLPILLVAILLPSITQAAISPAQLITLANQDRAANHLSSLHGLHSHYASLGVGQD